MLVNVGGTPKKGMMKIYENIDSSYPPHGWLMGWAIFELTVHVNLPKAEISISSIEQWISNGGLQGQGEWIMTMSTARLPRCSGSKPRAINQQSWLQY